MKILEKRKKLNVVLQYVPAVIIFLFWFFVWRRKDADGAAFAGLLCIGLVLLVLLLDIIKKLIGNERRFVIVLAVVIFCCSLYFWLQGSLFLGTLMTLAAVFIIVYGCFLRPRKKTIFEKSAPIRLIYLPIFMTFMTTLPHHVHTENRDNIEIEVTVEQETAEEASEPDEVPDN